MNSCKKRRIVQKRGKKTAMFLSMEKQFLSVDESIEFRCIKHKHNEKFPSAFRTFSTKVFTLNQSKGKSMEQTLYLLLLP